ncbi:MAG: prolipoprotein diacylglyceryl transferase family protein [Pirellulales bacterium]
MCSELIRIPFVWGGVPMFGFGVLLAVWAVASIVTLVGLVRQYGWSGETWGTVPVLLLTGAAIFWLPQVFPDGLPLRGYGLMVLAGISAGVALAVYRARQQGIDPELILSLTIWLVIFGVIGARLFYVIEYWPTKFAGKNLSQTLLEIVNIPEGGLVVYGALIGAALGFAIFVRKYKLPLLAAADMIAPSLAIGLAFGRIGCFLNGCCYGGETERPWAVTFPKYSSRFEAAKPADERRFSFPYVDQAARGEAYGFRIDSRGNEPAVVTQVEPGSPAAQAGLQMDDAIVAVNQTQIAALGSAKTAIFDAFEKQKPLSVERRGKPPVTIPPVPTPDRSRPVHPAQLYSAIDAALLCWLLWAFYPFRRHDGQVVALMLIIHPITRFLLEIIRTDEPAVFDTGLSISQNISVAVLVLGWGLWWYVTKQPRLAVDPATKRPNAISTTR